MKKMNCTLETCNILCEMFEIKEIRTNVGNMYDGVYEGFISPKGTAVIPFGEYVEIYEKDEFEIVG